MAIIGVIPSRWGSTRFPGKPLTPILGRPLVLWVIEAVKRAKRLDRVLVATDDERIRDAIGDACEVVMTASDLPSGTDRVAVAAKANPDDIIINIQGDEPLMDPELIDALADRMLRTGEEMATAACPIRTMDHLMAKPVVKVILRADDSAIYFSRLPIPCNRDGEADLASGLYWRHLGIYAYRGDFLAKLIKTPPCVLETTESLEQLRALWLGGRIGVIRCQDEGVGVDTPADVDVVEKLLLKRL